MRCTLSDPGNCSGVVFIDYSFLLFLRRSASMRFALKLYPWSSLKGSNLVQSNLVQRKRIDG
jgi:hypothetical protein